MTTDAQQKPLAGGHQFSKFVTQQATYQAFPVGVDELPQDVMGEFRFQLRQIEAVAGIAE